MSVMDYSVAHMLAGALMLASLMMLYQKRLYALINIYALQAFLLSLAVAWQAVLQHAPQLYITALIALLFKALLIPFALHHIVIRLRIHREIETVAGTGTGTIMLVGMALVALSMDVMLKAAANTALLEREDLAFALAVLLLGLLMMVTRRNAVSQIIGFLSLENGLILAAAGTKGMPFMVEISIAFSILVAFIVIGLFLFRIRERFDTVDLRALDDFRGERRLTEVSSGRSSCGNEGKTL